VSRDARSAALRAAGIAYLDAGLALAALAGKRPLARAWQAAPICSPAALDAALARPQCTGLGVVHAWSGTVALDVDDLARARALLGARGLDLDGLLGASPARIVGAAGRAKALFRAPAGRPPRTARLAGAFELRGAGGQDALPPSQHPAGHLYEWLTGAPDLAALPELPLALAAFWCEALGGERLVPRAAAGRSTARAPRALGREPADPARLLAEGASAGERNLRIFRAACALRRVGATAAQLADFARAAAARCRPPLPLDEAARIAASAARYSP